MTYVPQQKANLLVAAAATPQPDADERATSRRRGPAAAGLRAGAACAGARWS